MVAMDQKGRTWVGRCECNNNPTYKDFPILNDQIIQERGWTRVKRYTGKDMYTPGYQHLVVKFWGEGRSNEELREAGKQVRDSYFMAKDNGEHWFEDEDKAGMTAWLDKIYGKREPIQGKLADGFKADYS